MRAVLGKGRFLSAFIYISTITFSPSLFATNYSDSFIEQFTRVMHAYSLNDTTYKTEFTEPKLLSSSNQTFVPEEEIDKLSAHLQSLLQQQTLSTYYCKYPARYSLVQTYFDHLPATDFSDCPELSAFINDVDNISIVFAAGYMGNPASYFGHMFIKLGRNDTKLGNETLNIGANVPEGENPVAYMLNGLFGVYQTQYTSTSYYKQAHAYSQLEGRDLYEYTLNLSAEKVDFLSLHLYELQQVNFTYYFTHRNCAYEIYRFLHAIEEMPQLGKKPLFYPVHLIAYLKQNNLIQHFDYMPANKTKFSQLFFASTPQRREVLIETIHQLKSGEDIKKIATRVDKDIAEALLLYGYAHLDDDLDKQLLHAIKKLRLFFSAGKTYQETQFTQKDLTSRAPMMVAANWVNRGNTNGLGIVFRPAHYMQTDKPDDVGNGGKLIFLQASLFIGEEVVLDSLDIVDVHKSEIDKTGLYGDDELEWGMKVNYRNVYRENGRSDDLFTASGYIGDVYFVGKDTWLQYGINAGFRNNVSDNGSVFVAPTVNLTSQLAANTRILLSVGREFAYYRATNQGTILKLMASSQLNNINAISYSYEQDLYGRTLSIGYHLYF